jgi:hypothetical protein
MSRISMSCASLKAREARIPAAEAQLPFELLGREARRHMAIGADQAAQKRDECGSRYPAANLQATGNAAARLGASPTSIRRIATAGFTRAAEGSLAARLRNLQQPRQCRRHVAVWQPQPQGRDQPQPCLGEKARTVPARSGTGSRKMRRSKPRGRGPPQHSPERVGTQYRGVARQLGQIRGWCVWDNHFVARHRV